MKSKDIRTFAERAEDLEKVLTFSIMMTVKKFYTSLDDFKKEYALIVDGQADFTRQIEFCRRFGHTQDEYRKILGQLDGKRVAISDVVQHLSGWIHYRKNFSIHYKSGKSFHVHSYWYIDFAKISEFWNSPKIYDPNSDFYTKKQHNYIDKIILKAKKTMTKAEKEQYIREYNEGKRAIPLEQALKQEAAAKRRADKRRMTIAKKAAKETMSEYAKLAAENERLKAEIERLKSLVDKNADIPDDNINDTLIEFDDLDKNFPNGIEDDDYDKLSEECKRRLYDEFDAERKNIIVPDLTFCYDAEIENAKKAAESFADDPDMESNEAESNVSSCVGGISDDIPAAKYENFVFNDLPKAVSDQKISICTYERICHLYNPYRNPTIPEYKYSGIDSNRSKIILAKIISEDMQAISTNWDDDDKLWVKTLLNSARSLIEKMP